jgi:hypothetical protein
VFAWDTDQDLRSCFAQVGEGIAQEFALNYPESLGCLILRCCTSCGGSEAKRPAAEIIDAILAGTSATPEQEKLQLKALFCDETIERLSRGRREAQPDPNAVRDPAVRVGATGTGHSCL